jgi:hypothetical protein
MSFWLCDLREAERSLVDAQELRRKLLNGIPTMSHDDWLHDHWARATEGLAKVAERYLAKIQKSQLGERMSDSELTASIFSARF